MDAFGIENHGYSPLISQKYVVKGDFEVYDGMDLLHHAMLNTLPNINKDGGKDEHGKTIRIPDFEARQKADTLITEIRQAFVEWLHAQPDDFKERLTDLYNRKFNCYVRPRYDGEKQKADRPHEIRDFGQAAQIVFFLHDRNVSRLLNSFPDFPPPLLPAGEEPVFGSCFPLLFGRIFHEFAYYVGHRNVMGINVLLELFDRR